MFEFRGCYVFLGFGLLWGLCCRFSVFLRYVFVVFLRFGLNVLRLEENWMSRIVSFRSVGLDRVVRRGAEVKVGFGEVVDI